MQTTSRIATKDECEERCRGQVSYWWITRWQGYGARGRMMALIGKQEGLVNARTDLVHGPLANLKYTPHLSCDDETRLVLAKS
jgi:hypothetical protein